MQEVMLTIKETAERLRFTEAHLRKLLREKKIKGKKAGRMWLVPLEEVNRFLGFLKVWWLFWRIL